MQKIETGNASRLLSPNEAAARLGISTQRLANMRVVGNGPHHHKLGHRTVRYSEAAIAAWLAGTERRSTSDAGAAA